MENRLAILGQKSKTVAQDFWVIALVPNAPFKIGEIIASRYRIDAPIGRGATAVVYRAWQEDLDRDVAIKVFAPYDRSDHDAQLRFFREAKVAASLRHPGAVEIFEQGEVDQKYFIVMEYIAGTTLGDLLDEHPGRMAIDACLHILESVASVLVQAHAMGLVHRDLKPDNLMLETQVHGNPRIKVLDFGLAHIHNDAHKGRITRAGVIVGTPNYLSPEQARGDSEIGPAADLYALGCIAYEILCASPPYLGNEMQVVTQHALAPVPEFSPEVAQTIRPDLLTLITKLLHKDPLSRPTARSLLQALENIRSSLASQADVHQTRPDAGSYPSRAMRMVAATTNGAQAATRDKSSLPIDVVIYRPRSRDIAVTLGYAGISARTLEAAPHRLQCDILVVDHDDPQQSAAWLKYQTTVIAVVSEHNMQRLQEFLAVGVHEVVVRPLSAAPLERAIRRAFARAQASLQRKTVSTVSSPSGSLRSQKTRARVRDFD